MTRVAALLDSLPEITRPVAERWIAAALAEAGALQLHDESMYPASADPKEVAAATRVHERWADWADEADQLLVRLRPLQAAGEHLMGAGDLHYQIARARAILKITPQDMLRRQAQIESARVMSIEEVRSELRTEDRR